MAKKTRLNINNILGHPSTSHATKHLKGQSNGNKFIVQNNSQNHLKGQSNGNKSIVQNNSQNRTILKIEMT